MDISSVLDRPSYFGFTIHLDINKTASEFSVVCLAAKTAFVAFSVDIISYTILYFL
jgi:hypothetical protein